MKLPYQYQPEEQAAIRDRIKAQELTYEQVAKAMNRTRGGIIRAVNGERMTLLARIDRWLKKREARKKDTKSKTRVAA